MINLRKLCLLGLLILCTVAAAFAQHSLYDNPNYRRSVELRRMAESAFERGDYINAEQYSLESERLAVVAREEAETQRLLWIANSWKRRAEDRVTYGERNNAAGMMGEKWTQVKETYALAVSEFDAKRYEESTAASKQVVEWMADFAPVKLPAFYTVRLIPEARDCFWRIAGYPFIYGDPWKWKILYEANKGKIPEPGNPDWIEPGIVLTIPSLPGEVRSGTWTK